MRVSDAGIAARRGNRANSSPEGDAGRGRRVGGVRNTAVFARQIRARIVHSSESQLVREANARDDISAAASVSGFPFEESFVPLSITVIQIIGRLDKTINRARLDSPYREKIST